MNRLTIQLLGSFQLTYNDQPLTMPATPRLQALVAYLALHEDRPVARQELAFCFWPDTNESQARTNLRKQILYLRQALPVPDQVLTTDRHTLQWHPTLQLEIDVTAFERALVMARNDIVQAQRQPWQAALDHYQGELCPSLYDEWILAKREELADHYRQALTAFAHLLEAERAYPAAIPVVQQLLRADPLDEQSYQRLMRLHALNQDRAAALRVYHDCVTMLQHELDVTPGQETEAIYQRLLKQETIQCSAERVTLNQAAFVGRLAEWQVLQRCWRTAAGGSVHFVLLAGEAGIGKSRLAEELLDWANHQGIGTARTRSYAAEGRLAYAPVVDWLRSDLFTAQIAALDDLWLTEIGRLLPELLARQPTVPRPSAQTQSWQRRQLFEALARAIYVTERPLVLLIDDLQWCDQETLEWLHFLLRFEAHAQVTHPTTRLLVLGTARLPDEVDARHPLHILLHNLQQSDQLTQINLQRLSVEETGDLAAQMRGQALDSSDISQLHIDTEGNPLFVVETVRAGLQQADQPVTVEPLGRALPSQVNPTLPTPYIILPPKVYSVIQARLAQLSPAAQGVATLAAIIGRQFTLDVLLAAGDQPETIVVSALDELWQRRIVREQGTDAYDFSHDKIREVVYAECRSATRRLLHRRVAEALVSIDGEQPTGLAAQVAVHFEQAGQAQAAITYYQQAAVDAQRLFAYSEALAYLRRALGLLETLPVAASRDHQELNILTAMVIPLLVNSLFSSGELRQVYERAHKLSAQLGRPPYPPMLRTLAIHHLLCYRDFDKVKRWGKQLLSMAHPIGSAPDPVLFVEANYVLGANAFWQGQLTKARLALQAAVDAYSIERHETHVTFYGQDPGVYCQVRLGWTLWYLGYPDQARAHSNAAFSFAQTLNHPHSLQLALLFGTWLYCECRDFQSAAERYSIASPKAQIQLQQLAGYYLLLRGETDAAIEQIRAGIAHCLATNSGGLYLPHILGLLAEAYGLAGCYEQAFASLDEAFDLLNGSQEYWDLAELYRRKGELLRRTSADHAMIEACFQQALTVARHQSAKSLELRAAISLSRLWMEQGRTAEVRNLLQPIYAWFTEGFDTQDLIDAKTILSRLGMGIK